MKHKLESRLLEEILQSQLTPRATALSALKRVETGERAEELASCLWNLEISYLPAVCVRLSWTLCSCEC